jgi:hypothetical protein
VKPPGNQGYATKGFKPELPNHGVTGLVSGRTSQLQRETEYPVLKIGRLNSLFTLLTVKWSCFGVE